MTDREKVIHDLEQCLDDSVVAVVPADTVREVIALLKAQEPIAPIRRSAHAQGADDVWYECRECGGFLGVNRYSKQCCPKCGRVVKWDG